MVPEWAIDSPGYCDCLCGDDTLVCTTTLMHLASAIARVMPTNSCSMYTHRARFAYPLDKRANLTTRMASAAVAQLFPAKVVFVLTDSVRSKMHGE